MKIYLYCNKTKPYLYNKSGKFFLDNYDLFSYSKLNEKIIASCELDNVEKINKRNFAWYLKKLQLYKPFNLIDFNITTPPRYYSYNFTLDKNGKKCVVMPIKSQELVKILNNEQDYIIRNTAPTECFEYNKYQKALDRLSTNVYLSKDIKILQEAVNKANMFDKLKVNEND